MREGQKRIFFFVHQPQFPFHLADQRNDMLPDALAFRLEGKPREDEEVNPRLFDLDNFPGALLVGPDDGDGGTRANPPHSGP